MKTCHRMLMLVLTGLMIVSYFPINNVFAASYMQTKANTNLQGIDVSHWNGSINWPQVKNSGIAFAYIKASDGNDSIDPLFSTNVESARATSLPIGAYHYARLSAPFNPDEPKVQALLFVNAMKQNGLSDFGDIMPVLDLEEPSSAGILTTGEIADWARIFIDTTKSLTNRQVMLYIGAWFVQQYNDFGGSLSDLPLWIADYTRFGDPQPPVCGGWTQWNIWQYSDIGSVPGISGQVDLNAGPTSLEAIKGILPVSAVPATPTGFSASNVTINSVSLSWNSIQNAKSYTIKRNGSVIYNGTGTIYVDSNLNANTTYNYSLFANNANGSSVPVTQSLITMQNRLTTGIMTNSQTFYSKSYARITANIKDSNGQTVKGAFVSLTIKNPYGQTMTVSGISDRNGNFVYSYYIPKNLKGKYFVISHSSLTDYLSSSDANTSFYVKK